jgi:hypothetical protein
MKRGQKKIERGARRRLSENSEDESARNKKRIERGVKRILKKEREEDLVRRKIRLSEEREKTQ